MLSNETISKLNEMHLGTMASHFADQLTDSQSQSLSFEERFSILVDAEWSSRKSNRLAQSLAECMHNSTGTHAQRDAVRTHFPDSVRTHFSTFFCVYYV